MPFNKVREEFVRPQASRALVLFAAAHLLSLLVCMVYPLIMAVSEYSDARLNSAEVGNFQNFITNLYEVFGWFLFYSLPAFLVATGFYVSRFFFNYSGFRKIAYAVTFVVIFATLHLETGIGIFENLPAYGTAALYVAALFAFAAFLNKRYGLRI